MKIVQSTWVRYHHFDLARELEQMGHLEKIFTCLPWWKADKESREQGIPRSRIQCNFLMQGIRRIGGMLPGYTQAFDYKLGCLEAKYFSRWVANNLPECDTYIGISGSGLQAGRLAKSRGAGYIMDRGSTQIRYADKILKEEHVRWSLPYVPVHPWLIENEEAEAETANLITVPSDYVKQTFVGTGIDSKKMRVVPYGVSLKEFFSTGTPPTDKFRLVFVGQFSLRKGAPYLLEAFRAFKHPNKELIVVGNVPDQLKQLVGSIGTDGVKFVGPVPRPEVKHYLSTAHALVLPSIEEGLALVQAQAMACGCPIIATPNTGSETLFQHGREGLIIDVRNSNALTNAFIQLADNPHLQQLMGEAGIKRSKELGGWGPYAQGMVNTARQAAELATSKILIS